MPELPEVETVKRGLEKLIVGKKIIDVSFDWPKSFPNSQSDADAFLIGATIESVHRRAKVLFIELSSEHTLLIHLKMTGQLVYAQAKSNSRFGAGHPNDSLINKLPDKSTRVVITFEDESHLYFNDQRKFGWVKLVPRQDVAKIDFIKKFGPEPLDPTFTAKEFKERFKRRQNSTIKAALLDQSVVAGVGNIYADESLWGAKIHPGSTIKNLNSSEIESLFLELKIVLQLAIDKGGSTNKNYVNAEGKKGSYMDFARVFRRDNLPCPRCGTTIVKLRVAGRGTHICLSCQKLKNG